MSEPGAYRVEVAGRAFVIYYDGKVVNVLGCLTSQEVAQLQGVKDGVVAREYHGKASFSKG